MTDRVHYQPILICSVGTQVVTLAEILGQSAPTRAAGGFETTLYYCLAKWCQCSISVRCCWISRSTILNAACNCSLLVNWMRAFSYSVWLVSMLADLTSCLIRSIWAGVGSFDGM
jgi:hypothetical protein